MRVKTINELMDTINFTSRDLSKVMELNYKLDKESSYDFVDEVPKFVKELYAQVTIGANPSKKQERTILAHIIKEICNDGKEDQEAKRDYDYESMKKAFEKYAFMFKCDKHYEALIIGADVSDTPDASAIQII